MATSLRICFIGDSFVNGVGDPAGLGWSGRLCQELWASGQSLTCYNLGIRGDTSADIAQRWLTEARRRLPADCDGRLVFSFGVNDTTIDQGQPRLAEGRSVEFAVQILSLAYQQWPALMVGPPPIGDREQNQRIAQLSRQFDRICRELTVPYLDVFEPLRSSTVWMAEVAAIDKAHPGAAGYTLLAELVQRWPAWQAWFT